MAINIDKKLRCVNTNKVVFPTKNGYVIIDRIKTPKYYIGSEEFSEYDIRNLQLEIGKGNMPFDVINSLQVKDDLGNVLEFRSDGVLINRPHGFDISANLAIDLMCIKNNNNNLEN